MFPKDQGVYSHPQVTVKCLRERSFFHFEFTKAEIHKTFIQLKKSVDTQTHQFLDGLTCNTCRLTPFSTLY